MITLKYRRIEPIDVTAGEFYMLEQVTDGTPDIVRTELPGVKNGEICFGGKLMKIRGGACEIAFSDIEMGAVDVQVVTNGISHFATSFLKTEDKILRLPTDEAVLEALKAAYLGIEERVCAIESRISAIENEIRPHHLFDFN